MSQEFGHSSETRDLLREEERQEGLFKQVESGRRILAYTMAIENIRDFLRTADRKNIDTQRLQRDLVSVSGNIRARGEIVADADVVVLSDELAHVLGSSITEDKALPKLVDDVAGNRFSLSRVLASKVRELVDRTGPQISRSILRKTKWSHGYPLDKETQSYLLDPEQSFFESFDGAERRLEEVLNKTPRDTENGFIVLGELRALSEEMVTLLKELEEKTYFMPIAKDGEDREGIFGHMLPSVLQESLKILYTKENSLEEIARNRKRISDWMTRTKTWTKSLLDQHHEMS